MLFDIEPESRTLLGSFQGTYCYVGSAFGPGGVRARVGRHLSRKKVVTWHIDHLTISPGFTPKGLYVTPERVECIIACKLGEVFSGPREFGCTDCQCQTHLFRIDDMAAFQRLSRELGLKEVGFSDIEP